MTKVERERLLRAINMIHVEDDYLGGMEILCALAGGVFQPAELLRDAKPISIVEAVTGKKEPT